MHGGKADVNKMAGSQEVADSAAAPSGNAMRCSFAFEKRLLEGASRGPAGAHLRQYTVNALTAGGGEQEAARSAAWRNGPKLGEKIEAAGILLDETESVLNRRRAAWALAENLDDETMIYMEEVLKNEASPTSLKATVLEGLGRSGLREAKKQLLAALGDDEERVVRGAVRGLARIGDEQSVEALRAILLSNDAPAIVAEAAAGLGKIDLAGAFKSLEKAYRQYGGRSAGFRKIIIEALGRRDISETRELFEEIFSKEGPEMRLAVMEATADSQGDPVFLIRLGLKDSDSRVRAAAAWSLAVRGDRDDLAVELEEALIAETDVEVRMRLYQALCDQKEAEGGVIAPLVFAESDPGARLAGYSLLARIARKSEDAEGKLVFDWGAVDALQAIALGDGPLSDRLAAVSTLKKADTEGSELALENVFLNTGDVRVAKATGIGEGQVVQ